MHLNFLIILTITYSSRAKCLQGYSREIANYFREREDRRQFIKTD